MAQKCDIIRDALKATSGGKCDPSNENPPIECLVPGLATQKDYLAHTQYNPVNLLTADKRMVRMATMRALQTGITDKKQKLATKYGTTADDIQWKDFPRCLWNANGRPGGNFGNKYVKRDDMALAGYSPQPVIGGSLLAGAFFAKPGTEPPVSTSPMPVWLDRVMNPNMALLVIFAVLVFIYAAVVYGAKKRGGRSTHGSSSQYSLRPGIRVV